MATNTNKIITLLKSTGVDDDTACKMAGQIVSQRNKNEAIKYLNGTGLSAIKHKISKVCDKVYA